MEPKPLNNLKTARFTRCSVYARRYLSIETSHFPDRYLASRFEKLSTPFRAITYRGRLCHGALGCKAQSAQPAPCSCLSPSRLHETLRTCYRYKSETYILFHRSFRWFPVCNTCIRRSSPKEHDRIVQKLLFELATWHGLAKLPLHTEITVLQTAR